MNLTRTTWQQARLGSQQAPNSLPLSLLSCIPLLRDRTDFGPFTGLSGFGAGTSRLLCQTQPLQQYN